MPPPRYAITITLNGKAHIAHASTHEAVAKSINTALGYDAVSRVVIINWLSRNNKSSKYKFIEVRRCCPSPAGLEVAPPHHPSPNQQCP